LRELAAHHKNLAAGVASTPPPGSAAFESGFGAPEPTKAQLKAMAARAESRTDHLALAEYFDTAARRYDRDAAQHSDMAQAYRGTKMAQAAAHCDRLVTLSRDEAKEARALADLHTDLASAR